MAADLLKSLPRRWPCAAGILSQQETNRPLSGIETRGRACNSFGAANSRESGQNSALGLHQIRLKCRGGFGRHPCLKLLKDCRIKIDVGSVQQLGIGEQAEAEAQLCGDLRIEGVQTVTVGEIYDRRVKDHVLTADHTPILGLARELG